MRLFVPVVTFVFLNTFTDFNNWSNVGICLWIFFLTNFLINLNRSIAFREYILMMYGLNYLFSAAITYEVTQEFTIYNMKISPENYFSLAIPAMLCLYAGLYAIKTKIFTYQFNTSVIQNLASEKMFKQWLISGIILGLIKKFVPGDFGFFVYLLSGIKYVAAFGLFMIDRKKYKWYLYTVLFIEIAGALGMGMFHDMVEWILFFGLIWTFLYKPSASLKFVLIVFGIFSLYVLQTVKSTYREQLFSGKEGGVDVFSNAVSQRTGNGQLLDIQNIALSFARANQGWIFASTVNKLDKTQDFQSMNLVKIYSEAAFLPRFLSPDKLVAADKKLFNRFSGFRINDKTSMALGLFADGYISFGKWGTFVFAFIFGLICALVFKIIERWSKVSPYFVLFSFIILHYAVRADCETQTWMGHIVKGLLVFTIVIYFTKQHFRRSQFMVTERVEEFPANGQNLVPNTL
jgi:hypothetical protein